MESWGTYKEDSGSLKDQFIVDAKVLEALISSTLSGAAELSKNQNKNPPQLECKIHAVPTTFFPLDPLTQENIQLVQYVKQMEELKEHIQNSFVKIDAETIPPVPGRTSRPQKAVPAEVTLTRQGAKQLLHKAIFHVCAHEGFDFAGETVLDQLVDVTEEMLLKFTKLLKINTENQLSNNSTGFTDAMERSLHDSRIGGVRDLYSYYKNRVLQYNAVLRRDCEIARRSCITAATQWSKNNAAASKGPFWEDREWVEWQSNDDKETEFTPNSRRQSMEYSETNGQSINQLHLEDNSNDEITPSLEPGLRMLYTLEQQAAQGSIPEADEHFYITSNSPATVTSFGRENPSSIESSSPHTAVKNKQKFKR